MNITIKLRSQPSTIRLDRQPYRANDTENYQQFANGIYRVGEWDTAGQEDVTLEETGETIQETINRQKVLAYQVYIAGGGTDSWDIFSLTYEA